MICWLHHRNGWPLPYRDVESMPADVARGFFHLLRREAAQEREEMDAAEVAARERAEMAKLQRASGMS